MSTMASLITKLRIRLNDVTEDNGNYTNAELLAYLNMSKTEIEFFSRCNIERIELTTVASQKNYDVSNVIEIIEVGYQSTTYMPLVKQNIAELNMFKNDWDSQTGEPAIWSIMFGSTIKIYPTPDDAYNLIVYAYRVTADYGVGDDVVTIPEGVQNTLMLDRAEAAARIARPTNQYNITVAGALMEKFNQYMFRSTYMIVGNENDKR